MFNKLKWKIKKWKIKMNYIEACHREQPERCANPDNHSPEQYFIGTLEEIREVLDKRDINYNERSIYEIVNHLIDKWPGGLTSYNMWYVMHSAQDNGMLDKQFNPIKESSFVNEEDARREQIVKLGGVKALSVYLED